MIVDTPRLSLHVQPMGTAGSPIVMLHGAFVGNLMTWWLTAAPELATTHRVYPYDLRGHGRSARPTTGYDVDSQVHDLFGLIDTLGVAGPVGLVGHSFGAVIALAATLRAPGRVSRLALVDPPMPPTDPSAVEEFLKQPLGAMADALPTGMKQAVPADGAVPGRRARRLVEGLAFLATQTNLPAVLAAGWDVPDDHLARLTVPTLVIGGLRSPCLEAARRLAQTLPNARLVTLDVGHFVPIEAPQAVTAALAQFFDDFLMPAEVLGG